MICVQIMLKTRKTAKFLFQKEVSTNYRKIKEEDIVDESNHVASLTMSEEQWTAMRKRVEKMAYLCFIYDVNVKDLGEDHELSMKVAFSKNVHFVLADPPNNVRRVRKDGSSE